jgi:hypothetical protein
LLIQFESLHNGFNYLIIMIIVTLSKVIKHWYALDVLTGFGFQCYIIWNSLNLLVIIDVQSMFSICFWFSILHNMKLSWSFSDHRCAVDVFYRFRLPDDFHETIWIHRSYFDSFGKKIRLTYTQFTFPFFLISFFILVWSHSPM